MNRKELHEALAADVDLRRFERMLESFGQATELEIDSLDFTLRLKAEPHPSAEGMVFGDIKRCTEAFLRARIALLKGALATAGITENEDV